jgi:hypothetical protein
VAHLDRTPQTDHHDNYAKGLPVAFGIRSKSTAKLVAIVPTTDKAIAIY